MTKPLTDGDDVDARSEQVYGRMCRMLWGCNRFVANVGIASRACVQYFAKMYRTPNRVRGPPR